MQLALLMMYVLHSPVEVLIHTYTHKHAPIMNIWSWSFCWKERMRLWNYFLELLSTQYIIADNIRSNRRPFLSYSITLKIELHMIWFKCSYGTVPICRLTPQVFLLHLFCGRFFASSNRPSWSLTKIPYSIMHLKNGAASTHASCWSNGLLCSHHSKQIHAY